MKHFFRRSAAAGLALALTVTTASASYALGWDLHTGQVPLSQGATLGKNIFWSDTYSDLRHEYYISYTPNENVVPTVAYGNKVLDKLTLSIPQYAQDSMIRDGDPFTVQWVTNALVFYPGQEHTFTVTITKEGDAEPTYEGTTSGTNIMLINCRCRPTIFIKMRMSRKYMNFIRTQNLK